MIPKPYEHQVESTKFIIEHDRVFDASDAGTGKTRAHLDAYKHDSTGRLLVLCPKTIMLPAWGNDILKFTPEISFSLAYAKNRADAFKANTDIVIMNHDGVNWLAEHPKTLNGFSNLIIDESTAFKHRTSDRSRSLKKLSKAFTQRAALTGTPNPNSILDLWHQMLLIDDGERLGTSYHRFRYATCNYIQTGPKREHGKWIDKDAAEQTVSDLMSDITIRHKFEDCISIPEHAVNHISIDLSQKHLDMYDALAEDSIIQLKTGTVSAIHAASLRTKLLQLLSGAVYDSDHITHLINSDRYELVMELVAERKQSLVAFMWHHQRDNLVAIANKMGMPYGVIDSTATSIRRNRIVEEFQRGNIRVIFAHPKSAAHGLTLTAGTTTIWPSPTDDAELFTQFNKRIPRAGQTQKTETILISAANTIEPRVYDHMLNKADRMMQLLELLEL